MAKLVQTFDLKSAWPSECKSQNPCRGEGENRLYNTVFWPPHVHFTLRFSDSLHTCILDTHMHIHAQIIIEIQYLKDWFRIYFNGNCKKCGIFGGI